MTAHIDSFGGQPITGTVTIDRHVLWRHADRIHLPWDTSEGIQRYTREPDGDFNFDELPDIRTAIYVFTDDNDHALYVGKVHRTTSSIADRFIGHHALIDDVEHIWIIPVLRATPDDTLIDHEATFIATFRTPLNAQHNPAA